MPIRKSVEEVIEVSGARETWLVKCREALASSGFSQIESAETLFQIAARYRTLTVWGDLQVTLLAAGENTRLVCRSTAAVDNVWALFKSPTRTILTTFKGALGR